MKNLGIKTSLKLLLSYIVIVIAGTLFGACLYMIYSLCTMLVAGESLSGFSTDFFIRGLFVSFPISVILSCMFLVLYLIRHPASPTFPLVTYIVLAFISWLSFIPLCNIIAEKYESKTVVVKTNRVVSANVFRHDGKDVVLYTHINADRTAEGVRIKNGEEIDHFFTEPVMQSKSQFSDNLIEESIAMPRLFKYVIQGDDILGRVAKASQKAGYSYWICFASLGLALLSVIGLRRITSWRLLNTFMVIFATIGILVLNALYYGTGIFGHVPIIVDGWFRKTTFLQNPFMVICNSVIAIVFLAWGLCLDLFKKNPDLDEEGNPV